MKKIGYIVIFAVAFAFYTAFPATAQTSNVKPTFHTSEITTKKDGTVEVNVYLESPATDKISGASVYIKYPTKLLEYSESASSEPNTECKKDYKLTQVLTAKNDDANGVVRLTRVQIAADDALPSGKFCFGTLVFKAKSSFWFILPWYKRSGELSFSDTQKWEIVGPKRTYVIPSEASETMLKVTQTN